MNPVKPSKTRDRILFLLRTKGPQTAAQLARRMKRTPVAIRQHLSALADEELVEDTLAPSRVGRPARLWQLTDRGIAGFPDSHGELSVDLLAAMRRTFGDEGLDRIVAERSKRQLADYRRAMPDTGEPLSKRVAALAARRRDEGYMAEWQKRADGTLLLVENHCPICAAAQVCQGLCTQELDLFRKFLGSDVEVERSEHLLDGARRCVYTIRPLTPRAT